MAVPEASYIWLTSEVIAPNITQAAIDRLKPRWERRLAKAALRESQVLISKRRLRAWLSAHWSLLVEARAHFLECGGPTLQSRKLCDRCANQKRGAGRLERLAELRSQGRDPAHGGIAGQLRGTTNRDHQLAVAEWNRFNTTPDPRIFEEEILPMLRDVKIEAMVAATGLSAGYCSFIRKGNRIPHARHWAALRA